MSPFSEFWSRLGLIGPGPSSVWLTANSLSLTDRHHPIWLLAPVIFIVTEMLVSHARGAGLYRARTTFCALGCALLRSCVQWLFIPLLVAAYDSLLGGWAPVALPAGSLSTWLFAWIAYSFLEYWLHRLEHRVALLWTVHSVHHQGEDFNAALALRNGALTFLESLVVVLPLALLGIPAVTAASMLAFSGAYALLIHSGILSRFGILGTVLTTPSDHRVHHGINPEYLDRNFGTTLNVWDKLFGTYQREVAPPVFGTLDRFTGFDPFRANLEPWQELAARVRASGSLAASMRAIFGPPRPVFRRPDRDLQTRYDSRWELRIYAVSQLALVFLLFSQPSAIESLDPGQAGCLLLWVLATVVGTSLTAAGSRSAAGWEITRGIFGAGIAAYLTDASGGYFVAGTVACGSLAAVLVLIPELLGRETTGAHRHLEPVSLTDWSSRKRLQKTAERGGRSASPQKRRSEMGKKRRRQG